MLPLTEHLHSRDRAGRFTLYAGNCLDILARLPAESVDLVFADPPYNLSNGGFTCKSGRRGSVNKGAWDVSNGLQVDHDFNLRWLKACQRVLRPNGTIWVTGTYHVIYSIGFAMQQLGFKLLNEVAWFKPSAPPNLSCRYFVASHETVIWAGRDHATRHTFNYRAMKAENGGHQMRSVWTINAPRPTEKRFGKHPTQKPIRLLERVLAASTEEGEVVLDPFVGSGTTGVAAANLNRRFIGVELSPEYLELSRLRIEDAAGLELQIQAAESEVALRRAG